MVDESTERNKEISGDIISNLFSVLGHLHDAIRKMPAASNRTGNIDTWAINIDGTGLKQLTSSSVGDDGATWRPDGSLIYG